MFGGNVNDGRRIDAEFKTVIVLLYTARPRNPQQRLLAILPFLHDCLAPNLARSLHLGDESVPFIPSFSPQVDCL